MNKNSSEKYNIILIMLLFIIPILTLNMSYYFIEFIKYNYAKKEQDRNSQKEADILAAEADFTMQLSSLFNSYLTETKKIFLTNQNNKAEKIEESLNNYSNKIFTKNISSDYNIFVFKTATDTVQTDLIFTNSNNKNVGKKSLCLSFNYLLYTYLNQEKYKDKIKNSKTFAKKFLGENTDIEYIAKEMKGISSFSTFNNKKCWFIWDYYINKKNEIYGFILQYYNISDYSKYGRIIALKNLYLRSKCIGAFIPLYKDFEEGNIPDILKKSRSFNKFADKLTIQEIKEIDKWFNNSIKKEELGNYTAYCSLERGATHIAVVLVKSLKKITWPKWLIAVNILLFLIFELNSFYYIAYRKMLSINLSLRFTLYYALALILPFSLISVTTYGYLLNYENTEIERTTDELQRVLKNFDSKKNALINEYRATFVKTLNDKKLIDYIKAEGADSLQAAQRVIEIFEKNPDNYLPILGVKLVTKYSGSGKGEEGFFLRGNTPTNYNVKTLIDSFVPTEVKILTSKLRAESKNEEKKEEKDNNLNTNDLTANAFNSLIGSDLGGGINKHASLPVPRENGTFFSYQIYDFLKIDGKTKYILFVVWDNQALDNTLIQNILDNNSVENIKHNYIAYKVSGQNLEPIPRNNRHAINNSFKEKTKEIAKLSFYSKKPNIYIDNENLTVAVPALNFNNIIFVGWVNKSFLKLKTEQRKIIMLILVLISLAILWFCNIRSVSVFLKPISSLKKALEEVSIGNYNIGFKNILEDEIGALSCEFSNMIDGLREKERISKLISEQAVKALERNSSGVLNNTETVKGVALVSDIRNFTGMSEKYEPTLITDLLNEHFAEMTKIISDNGGYIYKFIGDAIEAVFPDNSEFEKSAYERSFYAGCLMLAKLDSINESRGKRGLFPYKIGVGLCSGEMYSGSVGSLDTRLDYAILGDPLKKAAKFEALSIQNPSFPLVIDDNIIEKNTKYGFHFKKLDSKEQNYSIYSFDEKKEKIIEILNLELLKNTNITRVAIEESKGKEIEYFSLYNKLNKNNGLSKISLTLIIITLSTFITFGLDFIYNTSFNNAKSESDRECTRLKEHLKSNEVLKSAFETLCFDFYDELNKLVVKKDTNNFKEKIKNICDKYEKKNIPIPRVYCCLLKNVNKIATRKLLKINNTLNNSENIIKTKDKKVIIEDDYSHGFSKESVDSISDLAIALKLDDDDLQEACLRELTGDISEEFNIRSVLFRRSGVSSVKEEELFINNNKIFDKKSNNLIVYVFCGFPKEINDNSLIDYYKLLAGNNILIAFNKEQEWSFSQEFPLNEINFLKNNITNNNILKERGYQTTDLKIGNETWNVYCITRELSSLRKYSLLFNIINFIIICFVLGIIYFIIKYRIKKYGNSIITKLRLDIISAATLPILIVSFISYLYSNEDYNFKKSELRYNINNLINEVENKELYYKPFCENLLKNIANKDLYNRLESLQSMTNSKDYDKELDSFRKELINKLYYIQNLDRSTPRFTIKEFIIAGKNNFSFSHVYKEKGKVKTDKDNFSSFGKVVLQLGKNIFLKDNKTNISGQADKLKGEMFVDGFLEKLTSNLGNEISIKMVNFPNNIISASASYTNFWFYVATIPLIGNTEYVTMSLILNDNELKSNLCHMKNEKNQDNTCSIFQHFDSGSNSNNLYCFCAPNIRIGEFYFFNKNRYLIHKNEVWEAVKELGLASSWINSSFLPVSRKIELFGPHYLEMRRGNFISDNIFAAIGSLIPLNKDFYIKNYLLGAMIICSLFLILLITHIVTSDLLEPVKQLMAGAKFASKGDYSFRIEFKRKDELGILCDSFNKMMKGLEDKQLMNRMVSKTALKVSSNTKDISSKKEDVFLLYISVPHFDIIMKNTTSEELFIKLRKHIASISRIVINEGGDIDKIMGEKMLIVFHINKREKEDIAYKTYKAANNILSNKMIFDVAVGINYGQVISGFLGVGEKRDYTVIGDPVNVTARIESLAEKQESNRCLMSESFYDLVKENMKAKEFGKVELKGKSKAMKVYQLI